MGNLAELSAFGALGLDEVLQQDFGEDTAGGEVIVVSLQSIQCLVQRGGQALQLLLFLLRQMIQVHVVGAPAVLVGIDLVLDAVQTCHQDGSVAEIGVAGGIGITQLKAAHLGSLGISGNTDDSGAVGGCVAHGDRSLEAGHQTLEGVGGGVGQGAQGSNVLQQSP